MDPIWKNQFRCAKIGDRVWHCRYGWATITNVVREQMLPIEFKYDITATYDKVDFDGRLHLSDLFPSVFWGPIELDEIPHRPKDA